MTGYAAPLTDKSATLTTSSAAVVGENKNRRYLLAQNVSDVNIGVNLLGGTAVIGAAGTFTLLPNGSIVFEDKFVPTNALTAIAASGSGKVLSVVEG